ncbi:hypothetical protein AYO21_04830 [Fonsecaea monophora]|uniref:Cytochrome P450 oxidoreductase n=1 Tax=Fonsecaea monophora TaxID=254056 RepID=A0A177FA23_9EURO|nr:hypothetical protein AYO21_04830 [Fonsecaea monophora]KAH0836163.1 Pisatin demethylase [Fonsecaea pedrosoi]OAG40988.1 hypothetical protein AYO21_04830 [Fonsecaea monophora]
MALFYDILALLQKYWIPCIFVGIFIRLLRNRYKPGVRGIPGPFLASISDLWLFIHCVQRKSQKDYELHRQYDTPLLRLAPNTISVGDAEAVRIIYGWKPVFKKSHLYISQHQTSQAGEVIHNLSSVMDEEKHAHIRRPVAHAYAMSTVVEYEPLIDSTFRAFVKQINERFVDPRRECDLSRWLQMYAFDVIGEITFSKRLGFIDSGEDIDRMMYHTGRAMDYIGMVGQIPTVDEWLRIKGFGNILRKIRPAGNVVMWTMKQIHAHTVHDGVKSPDFLTRFIKAREKYPDIMTDGQLAEYANTNVSAGSDTTAIVLRELVYRLLTHEGSYRQFMEELKAVLKARPLDETYDKPITWTEGNSMVYFQALIKECLRIHPALGQLIPRVVPEGGVELCGKFIPAGTVVGCNAWTVHRDKKFYGEDADEFRPERWLDPDKERVRYMENLSFAFGGGPRVCIGKNIAMLEITKFIPEFFRRFEVHLVDPNRYRLRPGWLVVQEGLDVGLQRRDPKSLID